MSNQIRVNTEAKITSEKEVAQPIRRQRSQAEKDVGFYLDILSEQIEDIQFSEVTTIYHSIKDSYGEEFNLFLRDIHGKNHPLMHLTSRQVLPDHRENIYANLG